MFPSQGRRRTRRLGFTLIELLVVVAIIALLISILLPSLSRAKEQARVTKCLASLRGIGQASAAYLLDFNDLPWTATRAGSAGWYNGRSYPFSGFTEFWWGGGRPNKSALEWAQGNYGGIDPLSSDVYRTPPAVRPMNPYMAPQVSWSDPRRDLPANRRLIPMELPDNFKCPSDTSVDVPTVGVPDPPDSESELAATTWEWWGTSYAINWYWSYYFQALTGLSGTPYAGDSLTILGGVGGVRSLGGRLLGSNAAGGYASRLILFYENRFNYAMEGAAPRGAPNNGEDQPKNLIGWHRQLDRHAGAFMDGHAAYEKYDTRFVDGTGWTTWPNRPWDAPWKQYEGN